MSSKIESAQRLIELFISQSPPQDPNYPHLPEIDPADFRSLVGESGRGVSGSIQRLRDLKCVKPTGDGWLYTSFDGSHNRELCLGCMLDNRCGAQGTLEPSDNSGTDIEIKLRENFNYDVAISCIEYLQFLEVAPQDLNEYENWSAVYYALIERLKEMPKMQIVEELRTELDAYYKIYSVNFKIYNLPEEKDFWKLYSQEISNFIYSIYRNSRFSIREVLNMLNYSNICDSNLNRRWRVNEDKEIKPSGSRRTYTISQLFQAYTQYLKAGKTMQVISQELGIGQDGCLEILDKHKLGKKSKNKRAEIMGIPKEQRNLMRLFNHYWISDITFEQLSASNEAMYRGETLSLAFQELLRDNSQNVLIGLNDFKEYKNEARIFTTRKPLLSIDELIEFFRLNRSGETLKNMERAHGLSKNTLLRNFQRLGLYDFTNASQNTPQPNPLIIRNGNEYAVLNHDLKYVKISKLDYRIATEFQRGKRKAEEIHRHVFPFHWVDEYRLRDLKTHINNRYNPKVRHFGLGVET